MSTNHKPQTTNHKPQTTKETQTIKDDVLVAMPPFDAKIVLKRTHVPMHLIPVQYERIDCHLFFGDQCHGRVVSFSIHGCVGAFQT